MFGAEKLIIDLLPKGEGNNSKTFFWIFLAIHVIFAILLGWMIYRILVKKKKDFWGWLIPVLTLIPVIFFPYSIGNWLGDNILRAEGFPLGSIKFMTFTNLILLIGVLGLYFYFVFADSEREREREEKLNYINYD